MKYKITKRLVGYFSAVLLLFSFIVGILFQTLFTWHTASLHKQELKERALSITGTLSEFQQMGSPRRGRGMGGGYGAYLRFIDEIAMSNVWLLDIDMQNIETGHKGNSFSDDGLPEGAEEIVHKVFQGDIECIQNSNIMPGITSVTTGVPVKDGDGNIFAALLLHSSIKGMEQAQHDGIFILLFCILAALIFAAGLSVLLARRFIKPLQVMYNVTGQLINGNYQAKTGIKQNDETGILACNIDELSERLSVAEAERKELDQMRQDFISNISHELRTPVTVIKGSLEVLDEGLVTGQEEMKEYFHQMLADVSQLQRLVNDLLELSRLQNTSFKIEKTKINITDVVFEAVRSMRQAAAGRNITINTGDAFPFPFYGDYGRLRQMFTIVLDNAIKFSEPGQAVAVKVQECHDGCEVIIADSGKGIPEEYIPYIFDRFYKEQSGQNRTGSGLGLSIAKQIANRHGIEISCVSKEGEGAVFSFRLYNN
ncbi:MAG: two-component sensor histidine kinase [Lachnospiraceae bacterium]|nr:two-component sensor histidine kinase [Lachnospiraceae bacterium]